MLKLFLFFSLSVASIFYDESFISFDNNNLDAYNEFRDFVETYNKTYNTTKEYWYRFTVFEKNYNRINSFNAFNRSYELGINKFADLTINEFSSSYLGFKSSPNILKNRKNTPHFFKNVSELPDSVDWRSEGLVTDVKDQGPCGSCWAFSAIATLEGQHAKKSKKLVSLSEENIVNCANNFGNFGCDGGWPNAGLSYIKYNNGVDTEKSYPYNTMDGNCTFNKSDIGATVNSVVNISSNNYTALMNALANVGPISVAIDAEFDFQFYKNGIFESSDCDNSTLNHAVTAVGYGISPNGKRYYIIKNSWGTDWGMNGYIYFSRDIKNMCGILKDTCYPIV